MVEFSSTQLMAWISMFIWPFCRFSGFFAASPIFGHTSIPTKVKIGLAALLSLIVAPLLEEKVHIPLSSWEGIFIIVMEFTIGAAMGMVLKMAMASIQAAGEYISLQMSLSMAVVYSPDTASSNSVISRFLYMTALLLFLALNCHLFLLEIFIQSFKTLPLAASLNMEVGKAIAAHGSTIFATGLLLSLPIMTTLLIVNLAMGILNRSAQQLSIFSIGFPITIGVGMLVLMLMARHYDEFLANLFESSMNFTEQIIGIATKK